MGLNIQCPVCKQWVWQSKDVDTLKICMDDAHTFQSELEKRDE